MAQRLHALPVYNQWGSAGMKLSIESVHMGSVMVLAHERFKDERGFFMETYRADHFRELGLPTEFVQDNLSRSSRHVLRGLHFQWDPPVGKLMRVAQGRAYLVAVDIRKDSPTLGQSYGIEVSADDGKQVWHLRASRAASVRCPIQSRFSTSARVFTTARPKAAFGGTIPPWRSPGRSRTQYFRARTSMPAHWQTGLRRRTRRISAYLPSAAETRRLPC